MLNLNDTHLAALIAKPLNVSQLRQQISTAYQTEADRLADSPLWGSNDDALTALLASYTGLMRDKLYQTLQNIAAIPTNFYRHCGLKTRLAILTTVKSRLFRQLKKTISPC